MRDLRVAILQCLLLLLRTKLGANYILVQVRQALPCGTQTPDAPGPALGCIFSPWAMPVGCSKGDVPWKPE